MEAGERVALKEAVRLFLWTWNKWQNNNEVSNDKRRNSTSICLSSDDYLMKSLDNSESCVLIV